jgi:hypothetical protein
MTRKFLAYQNLLMSDAVSVLLQDIFECQDISKSEGSVEQSNIDGHDLLQYKKYCTCNLSHLRVYCLHIREGLKCYSAALKLSLLGLCMNSCIDY